MTRRAAEAVVLLTVLMGPAWLTGSSHAIGPTVAQEKATSGGTIIDRWVDAVQHHQPGIVDPAVTFVWSLPPDFCASPSVPLFVTALLGHGVRVHSLEEGSIVDAATHFEAVAFLERAAVLHADAALLQPLSSRPLSVPMGGLAQRGGTPSCAAGAMVVTRDGEYDTRLAGTWNWAFARQLLDDVPPRPSADPFVALWYQATGAALLQHRYFGEARTHLTRAVDLFPDDPQLLFELACTWETLGLPISQEARANASIRPANAPFPQRGSWQGTNRTDIPSAGTADGTAEGLFRRALDRDPGLVEARARLARLLEVRGHNVEAADELTAALANPANPADLAPSFYSHLFATRADLALGHADTAGDEARAALALFPRAQSALVAQSQVAARVGDVAEALAPLTQLRANAAQSDAGSDPWQLYAIGPGRTANARLRSMWAKLPH